MTILLSVSQISAEFSLSRATVAKRLEDLTPTATDKNAKRYRLKDILPILLLDLIEQFPATDASGIDINEARRRREVALAQLSELDLDERKGDLIPAQIVERTWANLVTAFRARILCIPSKATHELASASELPEISAVLTKHLHEALTELSDYDPAQYKVA